MARSGEELGKGFQWDAILPPPPADSANRPSVPDVNQPRDDEERRLLAQWLAKSPLPPTPEGETRPDPEHYDRRIEVDGRQVYQYFQPMYAESDYCVNCHKAIGKVPNSRLQRGDFMALIRVTVDDEETVNAQAMNRALAWTAAIVIGFLSMLSLWAVVRYVIVKPVKHLRDVTNAVREGDVEQRADDPHRRRVRGAGARRSTACCGTC